MRNSLQLSAIIAVCFAALLAVGCGAPAHDCDQCTTQADQPNPFGAAPCLASDCFDKREPSPSLESYRGNSIQVGPDAEDAVGINTAALHEVKDGRPSGQIVDDERPREGVFCCVRCNRRVVGRGWHELWTADGTPLTCLCEICWQGTTNAEKAGHLRHFIQEAGLRGVQLHYVRSLIEEVERGEH